jgi:uncharacterized RDD family membrane protein YckC
VETPDQLRAQYGRLSDDDLQSIASIDPESLTPEARQALANELARRKLRPAPALPRQDAATRSETGEWRYPKARVGARLLAYIVDVIVAVLPMAVLVPLAFGLSARRDGVSGLAVAVVLIGFAWSVYYNFVKDAWRNGQSVGKKAMDLMVVDVKTNRPCTTGESALRALIFFLLNFFGGMGWLIESIVILASENGRRLGDLAAGTQVIDVEAYRP